MVFGESLQFFSLLYSVPQFIENLHFVRVHKSLRKPSRQAGKTQWIQQTPAMAANLARQPYTVRSLLFAVVPKQHLIG